MSYCDEGFSEQVDLMQNYLADRLGKGKAAKELMLEEWREYYGLEIETYRYVTDFIRQAVEDENLLNLSQAVFATGFCFIFRCETLFRYWLPKKSGL